MHLRLVLIMAVVLSASACGGKEKRLSQHLSKGREFFEQGHYEKAQVELKNVLQIDPKVAEPYYLFGKIEERQKNLQKAFGYYLKAVELDPANKGARAKLGTFYLFSGDAANATQQSDAILKADASDPDGLVLKASIQAREKDVPGAIAIAERVVASHPGHTDARSLLAALVTSQGDRTRARKILSDGVAVAPKAVDLRLILITLLLADGQANEAAERYQEVIALDPKSIEHRVGLARLFSENNQLDKAEATLKGAVEADPADDQRHIFLADFLAARRDIASAEASLKQAIATRPNAHALRFALANLYRSRGPAEKLDSVYEEIIALDKLGPSGLRARAELADLHWSRGKSREAASLVAEVLKNNPRDNRALMLRGRMFLAKADAVNAIADLRSVIKDQPDSLEVITELARAHLANDETALAKDTLAQALGRYPDSPPLRIMLAEIKTVTSDLPGAASDLAAVLEKQPRNPAALVARANLELRQGDRTKAERTLVDLKQAYPNDATMHHRLGSFYLANRKYNEAQAAFEAALVIVPRAIEPLTGLVNVYRAQGKPQAGVERVERAVKETPDNFLAWALLGHARAAAKDNEQAEVAFRTAIEKNPNVVGSHIELAKFLSRQGQGAAALQAVQDGIKALPDNAVLMAQLADLHRSAGKTKDAMQVYERMIELDAGNDLAANNLASLLLDENTDAASHQRAQQLAARFETSLNPAYLDSLGWAHYRLGAFDKAVEVLGRANARAPDSVLLNFHLGMALHKKGDTIAAKKILQKVVESKIAIPGIGEAKKILGES
ncbi:MAG: tetratricopeptide repeat protein [Burkholderiales bacterium]